MNKSHFCHKWTSKDVGFTFVLSGELEISYYIRIKDLMILWRMGPWRREKYSETFPSKKMCKDESKGVDVSFHKLPLYEIRIGREKL